MRRLIISIYSLIVVLALLMPTHIVMQPSKVAVVMSTASAAAGIPHENCIKLSIKIGGTDCVNNDTSNGGAIVSYAQLVLKFLVAGIGLVVILMVMFSGMQYITSAGDPTRIKSAKSRLTNAITALLLYVMAVALLRFIVPGAVL